MPQSIESPEIHLILSCLRWTASDPSSRSGLPIKSSELSDLNWKIIVLTAQAHRVLGFVAFALEQNGVFQDLPPQIGTFMTRVLLDCERQNREKQREFQNIRLLFSQNGIAVIPLKGIALSEIYRSMPFRQMGDLDILIRETDLEKSAAMLLQNGYAIKKFYTKNRWHDRFHFDPETPLERVRNGRASFEKNGLDVDLHWAPVHRIGGHDILFNTQFSWPMAALSHKDLVWHLILHTAEMHNPSLVQLLDLAATLNWLSELDRLFLEQKVLALSENSQKKISAMLAGIDSLFIKDGSDANARDLLNFFIFQESSALFFKEWVHETDLSEELRPLNRRLLYLAGYFFPNPAYYREKKGLAIYAAHWTGLLRNILNRTRKIIDSKLAQ